VELSIAECLKYEHLRAYPRDSVQFATTPRSPRDLATIASDASAHERL
jgi:hypothetical protein